MLVDAAADREDRGPGHPVPATRRRASCRKQPAVVVDNHLEQRRRSSRARPEGHHPCGELKVWRPLRSRLLESVGDAASLEDYGQGLRPSLLAEPAGHKSLEPGVESFLGLRIEVASQVEHARRRPCPHQVERADSLKLSPGLRRRRWSARPRIQHLVELPRRSTLSGSRLGELNPELLPSRRRSG
jgi:hypothetical protein